jgi:hypothetical protein
MSEKKSETAPTEGERSTAEPGATETKQKQSLGKFFLFCFGIPFVIMLAIGLLMSLSDQL